MSLKLTCTRKQSLINAAQSSASAESKQNTVLQHNSEIIKQQLCTIGELTQKIEALRAQRAREEEVWQALSSRKQALSVGSERLGSRALGFRPDLVTPIITPIGAGPTNAKSQCNRKGEFRRNASDACFQGIRATTITDHPVGTFGFDSSKDSAQGLRAIGHRGNRKEA